MKCDKSDREIERSRDREIERSRDREIERSRDREIRQRDRETERQRDRETERHSDTLPALPSIKVRLNHSPLVGRFLIVLTVTVRSLSTPNPSTLLSVCFGCELRSSLRLLYYYIIQSRRQSQITNHKSQTANLT